MNDTLSSIKNCLLCGIATPEEALQAAYRLGRIEGMIAMANVHEGAMKELRDMLPVAERANG